MFHANGKLGTHSYCQLADKHRHGRPPSTLPVAFNIQLGRLSKLKIGFQSAAYCFGEELQLETQILDVYVKIKQ